jgi:hypothetical protein
MVKDSQAVHATGYLQCTGQFKLEYGCLLTSELPRPSVQYWKVTVPPRGIPPAGVPLLSKSSSLRVL